MTRPAGSESFSAGSLSRVAPLGLPVPLTRDWAWAGATGSGIRVAIVDSGIDPAHPAVRAVGSGVALEPDPDVPGGVRTVEGPHQDLYGHGTACAAIVRRVAPEAALFSVRVLGRHLRGKGVVFAAGLRWAIDHGMQVVNMSLSTAKREWFAPLHELADEAYFRGMTVVCAVNNMPGPSYPSQYSSVVSVAAHEQDDPFGVSYNPSPPVEFGAPGFDVEVAWLGGTTIRATGNSFAAAHVSGLVARTLSKHPHLTAFQMKTILRELAQNTGAPDTLV